METPICDFVRQYADTSALRLHMPGHKGMCGIEKYDLTEIDGADVLYHARGIIRQSEENAAGLFGTAKTVYSTEGSSLCIRAMLYLTRLYAGAEGKRPLIAAGRNAHKTFMSAAALLDLDVVWLFPEKQETVISCEITAQSLERTLSQMDDRPFAVYLTSPDYLGNIADIGQLSQVCRKYGVLLLVDNAHGAYLHFLGRHPMDLGADLCCDSAHKTLPVLTGGAYLHISQNAPKLFREQAELAMSLFASTSPSYLILQSLDAANRYLADGYAERLTEFAQMLSTLKKHLQFTQVGTEPLKLTLAPKSYGYTGTSLAKLLKRQGIVCEFSDPDFVVMMLTPEIGTAGLARLETALSAIEKKDPIVEQIPTLPKPVKCLSMREALFSPSRELDIFACCGKILATASITCPPAIPILVCGEKIDEAAITCLRYYGISTCRVLDSTEALRKARP